MRRFLALLTVLALLFAACGDDGGSDAGGSDGDESSEPTDDERDPELVAKLLTEDELGGEWSEDAGSGDTSEDEDADGPECLKDPPDDPDHDKAQASFTFDADDTGFPSLQEQVSDYHDEASIETAFDLATTSIDSCGDFTYGPEDAEVAGSIEPLEFDSVGDESRTWTLHLSTQGYEFTAYVLYTRVGTLGLSLYFLDQEAPDLAEFGRIVELAVAKL